LSSMLYSADQIDPLTGLPKKKNPKAQSFTQQQLQNAFQPTSTFGPSPQVDYGFGRQGVPRLPGMPDYRSLIDNDAGFQQAKLDFGAQGVADASSLAAQTQRALTLLGEVPDFGASAPPGLDLGLLNQAVTPQTRELAQSNTDAGLSIAARQQKAFKDQVRQIKNALAARGALRSGEAGHQLQEAQTGYDQARFDTTQEFVEWIAGLQAGLAERQRQEKLRLAQEATAAEQRVRQAYPGEAVPDGGYAQGTPDPSAPPAPATPPASDFVRSPAPTQKQSAAIGGGLPGLLTPNPMVTDRNNPYGAGFDVNEINRVLAQLAGR
jgi:hypothetical protein